MKKCHRRRTLQTKLLALIACSTTLLANDKTYTYNYENVMSSSIAQANLGESCFLVFGSMNAGSFFKGLEYVRKTGNRSPREAFRKSGQTIQVFPDEIRVGITFETVPCVENRQPTLSPKEIDAVLSSVELQASWKRGMNYESADLARPPTLIRKPARDGKIVADTYDLQIRAKGVPLTDHLVISVFGPNKQFLTRITFDLRMDLLPPKLPIK